MRVAGAWARLQRKSSHMLAQPSAKIGGWSMSVNPSVQAHRILIRPIQCSVPIGPYGQNRTNESVSFAIASGEPKAQCLCRLFLQKLSACPHVHS